MAHPIIYAETNFLVALLFPHDSRHEHAMDLLARASQRECELRVPHIGFLEAQWTMSRVSTDLQKQIALLKDTFARGYRNGVDDFKDGESALGAPGIAKYLQRNLRPFLDAIASNNNIHQFSDPAGEIITIELIRSELSLRQVDTKDFYILASILTDLQKQDRSRPAIFMSSNKAEFKPGSKIQESFYAARQLLWRESFDALPTAVHQWHSRYP